MEKAMAILEKYQAALLEKGVQAQLRRRYFESRVPDRPSGHITPAMDATDRALARRKEKKSYHHQPNRYQVLILQIQPVSPGLVQKELCREYAFWRKKIQRAHTGAAPEFTDYPEDRLLQKLEKRLQILCTRPVSPEKLCRDTLADLPRYLLSGKYRYKKAILGRAVSTWEQMLAGVYLGIAALILLLGSLL